MSSGISDEGPVAEPWIAKPRLSAAHHEVATRVLLASAIVAATAVLTLLLWKGLTVLLLMFVGVLLAILIHAAADPLVQYCRLPEPAAVIAVLVAALALVGAGGWAAAPLVAEQMDALSQRLPAALDELVTKFRSTHVGQWLWKEELDAGTLATPAAEVVVRGTQILYTFAEVTAGLFIALFVALYAAATPAVYTTGLLRLAPKPYRPRLQEVLAGVAYTLRWWLLGQLVAMVAVACMIGAGLWLLNVPLPIPLALLAFVLEFVPNLGPVIATVPAVLLALASDNPISAVYVIVLYIVVQQIESLLITPLVQRRAVHLPPVLTIAGQLFMGLLAGPLGLVLATPLTATVMVLTRMLYIEDALGDRVPTPDEKAAEQDRPSLPRDKASGD